MSYELGSVDDSNHVVCTSPFPVITTRISSVGSLAIALIFTFELSFIVETGDFYRFAKGNTYAAYLGLAPGEHSSSDKINRLGITKAGNSNLRRVLVEAAWGICKGNIGYKSKDLKKRQQGNSVQVISYADRANSRMRSKYYRLIRHGKKKNVAIAAIARELACFVWGMTTDNIEERIA